MNQQRQEQTDGSRSAESRIEWTCPEVIRIDAGAAEAADINNTDGTFTS